MNQLIKAQKLAAVVIANTLWYWLAVMQDRLRALPVGGVHYLELAALALLFGFIAFPGIEGYGIINGNESLYVESAREMLLSGDFAVPTLNGVPYLEKPPLFIWLITAARGIFDSWEWAGRMVSLLSALALVVSTARFAVLLGIGATGAMAGFVLLTSVGMYFMSRVAMPDMLLTALFSIACMSFLLALRERRRGYFRLCAGLLGAAALVKGPLPLILAVLIGAGMFWLRPERRQDILRLLRDPWAALLLLLPMILWLAAIEAGQPGSASYFIFNEQILRFLGMREPHDYYSGSVFYYLPRLFLFFFPWAGVLFFGWLAARKQKNDILTFLWLCVWVPFGFFTLSSAKANYYIILCLPPMALLTVSYLPQLLRGKNQLPLLMAVALPVILLILLWAYRLWLLSTNVAHPLAPARDVTGILTAAFILVLAVAAVAMLQMGWRRMMPFCLGMLIIPVSMQVGHLAGRVDTAISAREMATYIQDRYPAAPVFLYQDFEDFGALPVYLDHIVPVVDSRSSDLNYGWRRGQSYPGFGTEEQVLARGRDALVVVMNEREQNFSASRLGGHAQPEIRIGNAMLYRMQ